jgi:hypothetical protein
VFRNGEYRLRADPDDPYTPPEEFGSNTVDVIAITAAHSTDDSTISLLVTC